MKKISLLLTLMILIMTLSSCSDKQETVISQDDDLTALTVIQINSTDIVLAGETADEIYTVDKNSVRLKYNEKDTDISELRAGITVHTSIGPDTIQSFPKRILSCELFVSDKDRTEPDIISLYITAFDEIWKETGNEDTDIEYISVDLTRAPIKLNEGETMAIAWITAEKFNAKPLIYTFDELFEKGYINKDTMVWENGAVLSVSDTAFAQENRSVFKGGKFSVCKLRAFDGAVFFTECTAKWNSDGSFKSFKPGGFAIS